MSGDWIHELVPQFQFTNFAIVSFHEELVIVHTHISPLSVSPARLASGLTGVGMPYGPRRT